MISVSFGAQHEGQDHSLVVAKKNVYSDKNVDHTEAMMLEVLQNLPSCEATINYLQESFGVVVE